MKHRIPLRHSGLALFAAVGFVSCGVAGLSSGSPSETAVEDPTPEQLAFFETKIRPVLAKNCYGCHGPTSQTAGLRVDTIEGLLKSHVLVKGDPEKSALIHIVRYSGPVKMPPAGKLKPNEIADLEAWVKMGAPWPQTAGSKRRQDEFLWSLQKVKKPTIPKVKNTAWVSNPIDSFVLAKLEAKGLAPAPPADRRALIRRATYDLTGLPPTAAEIQAFVADKSLNAYEKVVDRLLASPRYGERWARQWLDVARYADTKGYVFEEDRNYANAYTYREWVIKSFNSDLPYDQFITQQLAADRLPEVQNGDDKSALAAMGFLTIGRRFLNSTPDIIDDRIDVTMRGFQGFTVACARCHDHKFDPIPTQDYYSLYAVFDSSAERTLPISRKEIREPWERYNAQLADAEGSKRDLVVAQTKRLRGLTDLPENVKATLQGIREETVPEGGNLDKLEPSFEPAARERLVALQKEIKGLRDNPPATPEFAMAMVDGNVHDGVVFKRGNPGAPGDPAPRRFLLALSEKTERDHWTSGSGRLELAKAIASKDNPLTARVFVNRIWLGHFGAGIVRTPSDFGHQGEKPTDPQLLDYLASTFMENGWSIKRLHRMIVTSATYRQSSDASAKVLAADPDNRLWGRMNRRRLDLEQMRDTLLAATGRLDLGQVGGRSVDLWSRPFSPRRAVYGFIERQNLPGIFRTFDFASPDSTSPRRFQTTVPQQALFFLNSPFSVEAAQAVASRTEVAGAADNGQRLRRLYLLLFGRLPDAEETVAGLAYLKQGQPKPVGSTWQYGYGGFEGGKTTFKPFANYVDRTYRFAPTVPDKERGYLQLNQGGGHPGPKVTDGAIRRWVAPAAMTVSIRGVVQHPNAQGDGVRARIVSSRLGLLGEWTVPQGEAKAEIASVAVQKGETIDFIVDPFGNDAFDSFAWSPTVQGPKETWDAAANFGPPPPAPLSRLTLYAQALMMTNEFMFVD